MKIKGITIWERYVERIVLVIAVLAFIGFTALQFIGNPNAVEQRGQKIGPADVNDLLESEADRLAVMLRPDAPAAIDIDDLPSYRDAIAQKMGAPVSPAQRLARIDERHTIETGAEVLVATNPFAIPEVPAPGQVVVKQFFDALLPEVVADTEGLTALFPSQPFDVTWMNPVAVFKLSDVLEGFKRGDPQAGRNSLPVSWYGGLVAVLDVQLEREELVDGTWTNRKVLEPIPGQTTLREELGKINKADAAYRERLLAAVTDPSVQAPIVQPEFYATTLGSWTPTDPRVEQVDIQGMSEEDAAIAQLKADLKKKQIERGRTKAKLDELGCDDLPEAPGLPTRPPAGAGGGPPGRGGPPGGGMGMGGGGRGRRGPTAPSGNIGPQCSNLTAKLAKLDSTIKSITDRLAAIDQSVEVTEEKESAR